MSERESLTAVRNRLQEEFDNLTYPVQWGTFMLGRVAQLEAELVGCRKLAKSYIDAYEKLAFEDGFFCQKCGTVYMPEIMACRTCHPKAYEKLDAALKEVDDD